MTEEIRTVKVSEIQSIIDDPEEGIVSLVGDDEGRSLITGEIYRSSVVTGALAVEIEHGTVYLDPDGDQRILIQDSEATSLDPLVAAVSEAIAGRGSVEAARLIRDTDPDDDLWKNYLGPMLDSLEEDYTLSASLIKHQDRTCPRHGGSWGDDPTCLCCVNKDGTIPDPPCIEVERVGGIEQMNFRAFARQEIQEGYQALEYADDLINGAEDIWVNQDDPEFTARYTVVDGECGTLWDQVEAYRQGIEDPLKNADRDIVKTVEKTSGRTPESTAICGFIELTRPHREGVLLMNLDALHSVYVRDQEQTIIIDAHDQPILVEESFEEVTARIHDAAR